MSDGVRYWIVFVKGINIEGEETYFGLAFCGKKIIWEYLLELVEEEYELRCVEFNGYNEISEQEFHRISESCE